MDTIHKYLTKENILYGLASLTVYRYALSPVLRSLRFMYKQWLRPRRDLAKRYGKGSWVVITGCTSGIGEQFAYQLAALGFNIVLVSRTLQKLNRVKETINSKFPQIEVKIYQLDLTSTNVIDYQKLADNLRDLDVSILVNNAGFAKFHKFGFGEIKDVQRMINTNMGPYCYLTHYMMPKLKKREVGGKRSAIIFTSSVGADMVLPYLSTYVATKSFNNHFAKSLSYEVYDDKIDVLSLKPMSVYTGMNPTKPSGISVITAAECVSGCLDKLGYEVQTLGSWKHELYYNRNQFMSSFFIGFSFEGYLARLFKQRWDNMQKQKKQQEDIEI